MSEKTGRELRRGAGAADSDRACVQTRHTRRMPPIRSNTRWCRTPPTSRCSRPERQQLARDRSPRHWRRSFRSLSPIKPELLAHHRTEAGHLVRGDPAVAQSRRVGARTRRPAGERELPRERTGARRAAAALSRPRQPRAFAPGATALGAASLARLGERQRSASNATAILRLAQRQSQPQSLLVGLWGMWINTITQGRVAETPPGLERLLAEGKQNGDIDLQILGHRARLSSHFYLGELRGGARAARPSPGALRPRHAQRWMELTGNDIRTAVGVFALPGALDAGLPGPGCAAHAIKRMPMPAGWDIRLTSAGRLTWGAYVFDYRREPDRLLLGAIAARGRSPRARAEHSGDLQSARAHGRRSCAAAQGPLGRSRSRRCELASTDGERRAATSISRT